MDKNHIILKCRACGKEIKIRKEKGFEMFTITGLISHFMGCKNKNIEDKKMEEIINLFFEIKT